MNTQPSSLSFTHWVWQDRENRITITLSTVVSIAAFIWLKLLYPFPNFLPDSYSYLKAAFNNQSINMWPIDYSMFLRLFSSFTRSDTALIFTQYLLLQTALLYFLLTLRYLLAPPKWTMRVILIASIANPLSLLISNFESISNKHVQLSINPHETYHSPVSAG